MFINLTTGVKPMKKITLATVKKFIRENKENLFVKENSSFDGMVDGVRSNHNAKYQKVDSSKIDLNNSRGDLGISGFWIVGGSRDNFSSFEENNMVGISVYNCCGDCVITTVKK